MLTEADIERIMGAVRVFAERVTCADDDEIIDDMYFVHADEPSVSETNGLM